MKPTYRRTHRETLCEEFNDSVKYTSADITNTINQLSKTVPAERLSEEPASPNNGIEESILEYIRKVEGYRIRLRELHWSTTKHSEHILTDNIMGILTEHEDNVAEVCMGVLGIRIKVGQVVPILPEANELKPLLDAALEDAVDLKTKVEDNDLFSGLTNILDDCIQELSKGKYLETLS